MYPEPDFYFLYRSLIESYRIVPEAAAAQLDEILERLFSEETPERRRRRINQTGGIPS